MQIRVLYFARLRETLGLDRETLALDGDGRNFRMAVNQDIAAAGTTLREGDEVALFPPVTGG